jgi:hypothetical protein
MPFLFNVTYIIFVSAVLLACKLPFMFLSYLAYVIFFT